MTCFCLSIEATWKEISYQEQFQCHSLCVPRMICLNPSMFHFKLQFQYIIIVCYLVIDLIYIITMHGLTGMLASSGLLPFGQIGQYKITCLILIVNTSFGGNPDLCSPGSCNQKNGNKFVVPLVASLAGTFMILITTLISFRIYNMRRGTCSLFYGQLV